jgi:hypothetical protein
MGPIHARDLGRRGAGSKGATFGIVVPAMGAIPAPFVTGGTRPIEAILGLKVVLMGAAIASGV